MRLMLSATTVALLVPLTLAPLGFAMAQTTAPATPPAASTPATPAPDATPAAPMAPSMSMSPAKPAKTAHKHQTLQQRFDAANTTHDGHLTQAQAAAAKWKYIDTHFTSIDKDKKGYVTVDDIHAYAHVTRAAHHKAAKPAVAPAAAAPATTN